MIANFSKKRFQIYQSCLQSFQLPALFLALSSDVDHVVGRCDDATKFKRDFGTPENIDGGFWGCLPPLAYINSQSK